MLFAGAADAGVGDGGRTLRSVSELAATEYAEARGMEPGVERVEAFGEAARLWGEAVGIAESGGVENGGLHFNLGSALLMAGEVGPAIAAYLRAERLRPGDERVARGVGVAREKVRARVEGAEGGVDSGMAIVRPLVWAHRRVPGGVKVWVFVVSAACFWGVLGVRLVRREAGPWPVAAGCFAVALLTSASVAADVLGERADVAVVVAEGVAARTGPGEGYGRRFTEDLSEGVELRVEEVRGGWVAGRLADGRRAWVERGSVEVVD